MHTINEPGNPFTFSSTRGESNIDLTIASESLLSSLADWKVLTDCTTSDHNLILFELKQHALQLRKFYQQGCYDIKKADWEEMASQIDEKFDLVQLENLRLFKPNKAVALFNELLNKVCKRSIPMKRICTRAVPWWNDTLDSMRRETSRAKKRLMTARKLELPDIADYVKNYKFAQE